MEGSRVMILIAVAFIAVCYAGVDNHEAGYTCFHIFKNCTDKNKMASNTQKSFGPPQERVVFLIINALNLAFGLENKYQHKNIKIFDQTVPVLKVEGGKYIRGSHDICAHLAKNSTLYPKDLRGIIDHRLDFDSNVLLRLVEYLEYPFENDIPKWKHDFIQGAYNSCEKFLKYYNYVCGNSLTIADFCFVASISFLDTYVPIDGAKYPRLIDWFKRMKDLPYYHDVFSDIAVCEIDQIGSSNHEEL